MHQPGPVVVSAEEIARLVDKLAAQVAAAEPALAGDRPLVLLCVLKGSLLLTADLCRALQRRGVQVEIEMVAVRSYAGEESTCTVELVKDVGTPLRARDVLIVEDVVDTGLTTAFLLEHIRAHKPQRLRLLTLLDKPGRRRQEVKIDYCGTVLGDDFVVGYGLDMDERWRELPDIRIVRSVDSAR
jgi:hypoxanthine phosphoribosyltransferase